MATDNFVTVVGNLTRDPELRYTSSGAPVANFGIASNRKWFSKADDEWREEVSFFDVQTWSQLAENVAESVGRGDRVVVNGRIEQRTWETDKGEKRSKVEIVADEVSASLRWATVNVHRNEQGNNRETQRDTSQDPF